jgi:enediyne biosynthesis protein E7
VSEVDRERVGKAASIPIHKALPALVRDPLGALVAFGNAAEGAVVRLNLGAFRPFLVTSPVHVQHVLRDNAANYLRDGSGMLWGSVKRLFGEGIMAEGRIWQASRKTLQPLFTAKRVDTLVDGMADEITKAVDAVPTGQAVDIGAEVSRIVCRAVIRMLFADRVSVDDAVRIVSAQNTIATAIVTRLLMPFVPNVVPMPGDRAFRDSVRQIDDILLPAVRRARAEPHGGDDIISTLCRAKSADGGDLDERQIRNDTVSMFAAATETTYGLLTFLWPTLDAHPDVAARLYQEIDDVIGDGTPNRSHLARLTYTRMVLEEMLRLYPVGWLLPRVATRADVIGGVRIPKGAAILMSPYITQRMDAYWDRPAEFDPDRFTAQRAARRHRYTHYPFGGGPHQCIGQHLFYLEAQLIVATILSRARFRLQTPGIPATQVAASLRPKGKVELTLIPRERADEGLAAR